MTKPCILSVLLICEQWPDLSEHVRIGGVFTQRDNVPRDPRPSRSDATIIATNVVDVFENVEMRSPTGFETLSSEAGKALNAIGAVNS